MRLLFLPNCSCAIYAGIFFIVNIELAQTIRPSTQKRLYKKLESWTFGIKDEGRLFQCSTLLLHWRKQSQGKYYTVSACKHTFSNSTFTLTTAYIYWIKPCCKGKTGSWINPVLLDLVHSWSEWCCFSQSLRSLLGSLGVALHTQDPTIQWITAIFIRLYGERASTVLQNK